MADGKIANFKIKKNPEARANLANALMTDYELRLESQTRSLSYLQQKEAYDNDLPQWIWALLWMFLGMLAIIAIDVTVWEWPGL